VEIRRGQIYWADWNPGRGSEQVGLRPALIIQNDLGNKYGSTTIIASLTTVINKPYPFLVNCTAKESGLPKDSSVDLAMIMTMDKTRLKGKCGELSPSRMTEIDNAIKVSLGF
jgi:mRNA interferase MazF